MAIKLADTARPNNYVDAEHLGTYPVAYAEDVWFADGTRLSEKTFDGQSIQVDELPLASATEEGHVYQYIGISGTYQHGCFYECVEDSLTGVYVWKVLSIVKNGVIYTNEDLHNSNDYPIGSVIVYTGEPQWDFFKGHHYEFVEGKTITTYGGNVVLPNGSHAVLNFKEKEIKVGNVIVDDNGSESYYTFNIVAVDGNTITLNNGSVYTDVEITDNVTTMDNFTGWIDIGGGGSEGNDYEEFIGTQAEWDALSQSQKNKYDGKIVNITDDEGSGEDSFYPSAPTTPEMVFNKANQSSDIDSTYIVTEKAFHIIKVHVYSEGVSHLAAVYLNGIAIGSASSYQATSGVGYTVTIPCNVGDTIRMVVNCGGYGAYDKRNAVIFRLNR